MYEGHLTFVADLRYHQEGFVTTLELFVENDPRRNKSCPVLLEAFSGPVNLYHSLMPDCLFNQDMGEVILRFLIDPVDQSDLCLRMRKAFCWSPWSCRHDMQRD